MNKLKIEYVDIEKITPYQYNPRKNDKAVEFVMNSIKEFGFKVPMVITSGGVVITGHTRLKAAKKLGIKEVPCIIADDLSEEQQNAFRLADNETSEQAKWNKEMLEEEMKKLLDIFDMTDFGFPIQIDDIDIETEGKEKIAKELDEANNYVVLEFFTESEWEKAIEVLGLERVATADKNPKIRRHGIGRVIEGKKIIDKLESLNG